MSDDHSVVLYFQGGPARRRRTAATRSLFDPPELVELQPAEVGALWLATLRRHGLTQDEAAKLSAVSASLYGRQLRLEGQHLSLQRAATFPRGGVTLDFFLEIIVRRGLAEIRRQLPLLEIGAQR